MSDGSVAEIAAVAVEAPNRAEAAVAIAALALSVKNGLIFSSISFDIIDNMIPKSRSFDLLYDSNSASLVFI